ncbi:unnamed protein product [Phytomonas sp. EM1]|nr:unnamed protein product [Phytomonas sp. EM1]|eukprot:CCW60082.1 unnamed protein product [Phytomonas sp. isolate EM1]
MERRRYIAPSFLHIPSNIEKNEVASRETRNHEYLKRQRGLEIFVEEDDERECTPKESSSFGNAAPIDSAAFSLKVDIEEFIKSGDTTFTTSATVCNDFLQSGESVWRPHGTSPTPLELPSVKPQLDPHGPEFSRQIQGQYQHSKCVTMASSHNFNHLSSIRTFFPVAPTNSISPPYVLQRQKEHEAEGVQIKTGISNDSKRYEEKIADGFSSGGPETCAVGILLQDPVSSALGQQHYGHSPSDPEVKSDQLRMSVQLELDRILPRTIEAGKSALVGAPTSSLRSEIGSDSASGTQDETDFDCFKNTVDNVFSAGGTQTYQENMRSEMMLSDGISLYKIDHQESGKILQEALAELPGLPRLAVYDRTHCPFRDVDSTGFTDAFHDRVQQELTNRALYSATIHQSIVQQWQNTNYEALENEVLESNPNSSPVITMETSALIRRWSRQLLLEGTVDYVQLGRHLLLKSSRKAMTLFHDQLKRNGVVDKCVTGSVKDHCSLKELVEEQNPDAASEDLGLYPTVLAFLESKKKQYDTTHACVVNLVLDAYQGERNTRVDAEADEVKRCEDASRHARQLLHRVLQLYEHEKDSQRPQQDKERIKKRRRLLHLEADTGRSPLNGKRYS